MCNGGKFKHVMNSSEKVFCGGTHNSHGKLASGLSTSLSLVVGTSIMHCVVMEMKSAWSLTKKKSWSIDMTLRQEASINSMGASGKDVLASQACRDVALQGPIPTALRL